MKMKTTLLCLLIIINIPVVLSSEEDKSKECLDDSKALEGVTDAVCMSTVKATYKLLKSNEQFLYSLKMNTHDAGEKLKNINKKIDETAEFLFKCVLLHRKSSAQTAKDSPYFGAITPLTSLYSVISYIEKKPNASEYIVEKRLIKEYKRAITALSFEINQPNKAPQPTQKPRG